MGLRSLLVVRGVGWSLKEGSLLLADLRPIYSKMLRYIGLLKWRLCLRADRSVFIAIIRRISRPFANSYPFIVLIDANRSENHHTI